MNNQLSNHFDLFNSNNGYVKILEYDGVEGIVYIWSLSKHYLACKACREYKDFMKCSKLMDCSVISKVIKEAHDPDYIETGDFEVADGYFNSIAEFTKISMKENYPDFKIVPLGYFRNISDCRKHLEDIKATLSGEKI